MNEKRTKIGTKTRPTGGSAVDILGGFNGTTDLSGATRELLILHPELADSSLTPVTIFSYECTSLGRSFRPRPSIIPRRVESRFGIHTDYLNKKASGRPRRAADPVASVPSNPD